MRNEKSFLTLTISIMKKILLSMLFFFGAGLAMMASPAPGSDDDNQSCNDQAVAAASDRPIAPVHHGLGLIKFEVKVKKNLDYSKLKAPKSVLPDFPSQPDAHPSNCYGGSGTQAHQHANSYSKVGKHPLGRPGVMVVDLSDFDPSGFDPSGAGSDGTRRWHNNPTTETTGHNGTTATE